MSDDLAAVPMPELLSSRRPNARGTGNAPRLGMSRRRPLSPARLALADVERQVGMIDLARLFADAETEVVDQGRW